MAEHDAIVSWLKIQLGTREVALSTLPGATSSTVYRVDTPTAPYVLRVFNTQRWGSQGVEALPAREAAILKALAPVSPLTPRHVASADADSAIGAAVLMSWVPGQVELPHAPDSRWLGMLAQALAVFHVQTSVDLPWHYQSWQRMTGKPAPGWFADAALWRAVQRSITRGPPAASSCLLHRDYHPVNVLWTGNRITGVVDWVNACMGPAGADVAHCRHNLTLMYGLPTADAFLDAYSLAAGGYQHDRYWDLDAALSWFPEPTSYPPWTEFGLGPIGEPSLIERVQQLLEAAIA